jgi:xanthine/CO dehydrogenase XdhC/CoxF family maturation factor
MKELAQIARRLATPPFATGALATLVRVEGSSYRRAGARMLWLGDGTRIGSISGGCLEDDVMERLRRVATSGTPECAVYDTTSENDLVWGVGLGCHGVVHVSIEPLSESPRWASEVVANLAARRSSQLIVTYAGAPSTWGTRLGPAIGGADAFVQTIEPPLALTLFGAGNDAQPLARIAHELGWVVDVFDPRPEYATAARFPTARRVQVRPIETLADDLVADDHAALVIMTHRYLFDRPLLSRVLLRPLRYVGLLGPRQRAQRILAELETEGLAISAEMRERMHAPVGLDLGSEGAEEVAIAIVAEIQATFTGRDGRSLRHRTQPIHC